VEKKVKNQKKKEQGVHKRTPEASKAKSTSLRKEWGKKIAIFLVLVIVITALFPGGKSYQYADYKVGTVVEKEIIAPDDFPILKTTEELERERNSALEKIKPVFYRNEEFSEQISRKINELFNDLENIAAIENEIFALQNRMTENVNDSLLQRRGYLAEQSLDSLSEKFTQKFNLHPRDRRWDFIIQSTGSFKERFKNEIIRIINDIYSVGIVEGEAPVLSNPGRTIVIKHNGDVSEETLSKFYRMNSAKEEISNRLRRLYNTTGDTINVAYELINVFLRPDIIYNKQETEALREEAIRKVPVTSGFVLKNQRIIDAHEVVSEEAYKKIQSLVAHIAEKNIRKGGINLILPYLGKGLYVALILLLFFSYLFIYRRSLFDDNNKIVLISIIFLLEGLFLFLVVGQMNQSELLVPTTMASMLFAIIFDGITAFYGTIVLALIASGFLGNEFSIVLITIITGTAAIYSVFRVRNRSQIFKAALIIARSYLVSTFVLGALHYADVTSTFKDFYQYAIPNSLLSPMLMLGVLAGIESVFNVTSDMTLLELSDLNRPLLKRLSVEAPGTYHHSIIMGNLAERAAESIEANSLLARVGAYYHDIGKMVKPDYFIENLMGRKNKHLNLAPSMSCLIIIAHVKDGLEIAKKYKLPKIIRDFIPMHHGKSLITYFFEKAKAKTDEKYINEADFRYPGPKPQTKETGIVMLADSVEAATKSLKEPSASRIREMVKNIVESKFKEGELDECALTLKDLNKISESFITILTGMFHARIEYPGQEKLVKTENKIPEKL